eukprot:GILK01008316.1.p1 GENE.GILK01008316.1~~GILK01008316.1.p1  ORF type:complete len:424 (-),score=95.78 GILK01008316.1:222-1493(-)
MAQVDEDIRMLERIAAQMPSTCMRSRSVSKEVPLDRKRSKSIAERHSCCMKLKLECRQLKTELHDCRDLFEHQQQTLQRAISMLKVERDENTFLRREGVLRVEKTAVEEQDLRQLIQAQRDEATHHLRTQLECNEHLVREIQELRERHREERQTADSRWLSLNESNLAEERRYWQQQQKYLETNERDAQAETQRVREQAQQELVELKRQLADERSLSHSLSDEQRRWKQKDEQISQLTSQLHKAREELEQQRSRLDSQVRSITAELRKEQDNVRAVHEACRAEKQQAEQTYRIHLKNLQSELDSLKAELAQHALSERREHALASSLNQLRQEFDRKEGEWTQLLDGYKKSIQSRVDQESRQKDVWTDIYAEWRIEAAELKKQLNLLREENLSLRSELAARNELIRQADQRRVTEHCLVERLSR